MILWHTLKVILTVVHMSWCWSDVNKPAEIYPDLMISICTWTSNFENFIGYEKEFITCLHKNFQKLDCFTKRTHQYSRFIPAENGQAVLNIRPSEQEIFYHHSEIAIAKSCCGYFGLTLDLGPVITLAFSAPLTYGVEMRVSQFYTINATILILDWGYQMLQYGENHLYDSGGTTRTYRGHMYPQSYISPHTHFGFKIIISEQSFIKSLQSVAFIYQANDIRQMDIRGNQITLLNRSTESLTSDGLYTIMQRGKYECKIFLTSTPGSRVAAIISRPKDWHGMSRPVLHLTIHDGPFEGLVKLFNEVYPTEADNVEVKGSTHILLVTFILTNVADLNLHLALTSFHPVHRMIKMQNLVGSNHTINTRNECPQSGSVLCSFKFVTEPKSKHYLAFSVNETFSKFYDSTDCLYGGLAIEEISEKSESHLMCIDHEINAFTSLFTKSHSIIVYYYAYHAGVRANVKFTVSLTPCYGINLPCYKRNEFDPESPLHAFDESQLGITSYPLVHFLNSYFSEDLQNVSSPCVVAQYQAFEISRHAGSHHFNCHILLKRRGLWKFAIETIHAMEYPLMDTIFTIEYPYVSKYILAGHPSRIIPQHAQLLCSHTLATFFRLSFVSKSFLELTITVTPTANLHVVSGTFHENLPLILGFVLVNIEEQFAISERKSHVINAESKTVVMSVTKYGIQDCKEVLIYRSEICPDICRITDNVMLVLSQEDHWKNVTEFSLQ